jgi:inner membrane transporter RhtA
MYGALPVVVAILMQALSNGLLSDNLSGNESVLLTFSAFSFSAVVFGIVARIRRAGADHEQQESVFRGERLKLLLLLNLATAVTFLCFYWSLSLVPAALASAVETGIGPLAMACYGVRSKERGRRVPQLIIGVLALALAVGVAGRIASVGEAGTLLTFVLGLTAAATAGVSAAGIAVISHRFGRLKVSPVRVTAHRFHLTYVLAPAVLLGPGEGLGAVPASRIMFIVVVAVAGVSIPLFVLQVGMQRTAPMVVTLLASVVPSLTYLTATLLGDQAFDLPAFVMINGSLAVAFLGPAVLKRGRRGTVARSVQDGVYRVGGAPGPGVRPRPRPTMTGGSV